MDINPDNYSVGEGKNIKLLPLVEVGKLPRGTEVISITGKVLKIGTDVLDMETTFCKRSKYGTLTAVTNTKSKTAKVDSMR